MIGVGAGIALGADDGFACLDVAPDTRFFRGVPALGSLTRIRSKEKLEAFKVELRQSMTAVSSASLEKDAPVSAWGLVRVKLLLESPKQPVCR
jgi:hypothetical protein